MLDEGWGPRRGYAAVALQVRADVTRVGCTKTFTQIEFEHKLNVSLEN